MDNANSQAAIKAVSLPPDAETASGTSRSDLIAYILGLMEKSSVTGINAESPTSLDINRLQTDVSTLKTHMADEIRRTPIKVSAAGVNEAVVTVPLPSTLPSNLYTVDMAFVGGGGAVTSGIRWAVVDGSKTTSQFQVRVSGDATAYSLDFTVTPQ